MFQMSHFITIVKSTILYVDEKKPIKAAIVDVQ